MGATALSTSNIYEVAISTAAEAMIQEVDRFAGSVSTVMSTAKSLRVNTRTTVGAPATWDGTSDLSGHESLGVAHTDSFSGQKYQLNVSITKDEMVTLTESILATKVREAAQRVLGHTQHLVMTEMAAGFTTTVHDGKVGTTAALSAGHYCRDGSTLRSNLITDQLSAPALAVAIQRLHNWLDYEGQPLLPQLNGYTLWVDPRNLDLAEKLVFSERTAMVGATSEGATATIQDQRNPLSNYGLGVKTYPFSTISGVDPDNWFLAAPGSFLDIGGQQEVSMPGSQLLLWWRYGPDIDIKGPQNTLNKGTKIEIDFELKVGWLPPNSKPWIGSDCN